MNYGREAKGRLGWQREDRNEDFLCRIQCVYLEWTNDKMQIIPSACSLRVLVPCSRAVTSPSVRGENFCSFGVDILHVPLFPQKEGNMSLNNSLCCFQEKQQRLSLALSMRLISCRWVWLLLRCGWPHGGLVSQQNPDTPTPTSKEGNEGPGEK